MLEESAAVNNFMHIFQKITSDMKLRKKVDGFLIVENWKLDAPKLFQI